ncbi:MAG: polysaccharide deacetylase family protein [Actinomycetota bacterium]
MRTLVKQVLGAADRLTPTRPGVTVLIYHRIGGDSGGEVDLDVDDFRRQLEHLAEHHDVVTLHDAIAQLGNGHEGSSVVITFDDGTSDFVEHAVPALVEFEVPATLYVATQFVDEGTDFPWGAPPSTWSGLRDAQATGLVTIGSHTHTHSLLDRAAAAGVADELDRSIELIGEHLGTDPRHFAYPKALPGSPDAEDEVRRRFATAALARSRVNIAGKTDLHRLSRTPIQRSDGFEYFARKAAGGMVIEGELRHAAARVRYRGASQ